MKRLSVLFLAALASGALLMAQGCTSGRRTTTTTTTKSDEPDSVLGATAYAVATIILPFRLGEDALGLLV